MDSEPDLAKPDLATAADLADSPAADLASADRAPDLSRDLGGPDSAPSCSPAPVATERRPYALHDIAAGDFDGDGHADFVVVSVPQDYDPSWARREWTFWGGHGDGSFTVGARTPLTDQPTAVVAGDFDGDGRTDLAMTLARKGVEVWYGDAQAKLVRTGFIALTDLKANSAEDHRHLERLDVTGDGVKDLVTATDNFLWTLPGVGGGFGTPVSTDLGLYSQFALGDFDEDGRIDAVTSEHGLAFRRGAGDGRFAAPAGPDRSNDFGVWRLSALDYDGDGHLDVVVDGFLTTGSGPPAVWVLLGHGDGSFGSPTQTIRVCSTRQLVDLDGDGIDEMVTTPPQFSRGQGGPAVWRRGAGGWTRQELLAAVGDDDSLAIADFDEDGRPDLLFARYGTGTLDLVRGRSLDTVEPLSEGAQPADVAVADFDGDGRLDALVANYAGEELRLHRAGAIASEAVPLDRRYSHILFAGDLDEDGHPDVVAVSAVYVSGETEATLILRWDPANNGFAAPVSFHPEHDRPYAVADLDGDGHLDILQSNRNVWAEAYFSRGRGDGTFADPITLQRELDAFELRVDDLDSDGVPDHFSDLRRPDLMLSVFADARWLDLDGDGLEDAVYGFTNGKIQAQLGRPGHALSKPIDSPDCAAYTVALGDLDGDGHPDVITADPKGIRWCRGQGDGRFVFAGLITADLQPDKMWITDLDHDGCPDVIAIETTENTFSVIECVAECR